MRDVAATVRTIGSAVAICASIGAGAKYIGQSIWDFSRSQTLLIEHVRGAELAISNLGKDQQGLKTGLAQEHEDADKAAKAAMTAAKSVADTIPPIQTDIVELKRLAQKNLDVSNSHTPQLEKALKAVGSKSD